MHRMTSDTQIQTASGVYFDLLRPDDGPIQLLDIAAALSKICRYTGHTRYFYSVAEHCVRASRLVPPEHAMAALLHDAPEAYLGDVSRPLKALLTEYRVLEARTQAAILRHFGLPAELPDSVKWADRYMLAWERRDLLEEQASFWPACGDIVITDDAPTILPMEPQRAMEAFLDRYSQIACAADEPMGELLREAA